MTTDTLRARLEADRAALVEMLAATPDGQPLESGFLRILADTSAAISALPAIGNTETGAANGRRVVVVDTPGSPIILAAYAAEGERIETPILPGRALALAEELLTAGRQRLRQGEGR
ncbi:MAG: hypothetical protein WCJ64_04565 [Rhodospirillaceae bacterium]